MRYHTNSKLENKPLFEAAIEEFGDEDLKWVDEPMPQSRTPNCNREVLIGIYGSLVSEKPKDLSGFWLIFDHLAKDTPYVF